MICARCQQPSGDSAICKQCVARLLPTARHGRTSLEPETKPQVYDEIVKIIVDSIVRESEEKNVSPKNDIDPPSE